MFMTGVLCTVCGAQVYYKMQKQILFDAYKSYACCLRVELPTLNHIQWRETSVGGFEKNCITCMISHLADAMYVK